MKYGIIGFFPCGTSKFTFTFFTYTYKRVLQSIRVVEGMYTCISSSTKHIFGLRKERVRVKFFNDTIFYSCPCGTFVHTYLTCSGYFCLRRQRFFIFCKKSGACCYAATNDTHRYTALEEPSS